MEISTGFIFVTALCPYAVAGPQLLVEDRHWPGLLPRTRRGAARVQKHSSPGIANSWRHRHPDLFRHSSELELELIQTHMSQKQMLRVEVGACRFAQQTCTDKHSEKAIKSPSSGMPLNAKVGLPTSTQKIVILPSIQCQMEK